jgi:hypothetical protein
MDRVTSASRRMPSPTRAPSGVTWQ